MIVGLLAATAAAQPYTQSPYLDERVASGELPPLEERLPETPMVYEPIHEVGVYGGTFNVFAVDNSPWNDLTEEPARGGFMLEMTPDGEIIPGIALDFEQSEDFTTFTLYLRPGMQWSNGDPFTSEDFLFTRTTLDVFAPGWTKSVFGAPDAFVETPDEYTVIMHLGDALPRTLLNMVHWRGGEWSLFHPSTYLKQWHPDFNEDAEALAAEEGFDTWQDAFNWHREFHPLNDVPPRIRGCPWNSPPLPGCTSATRTSTRWIPPVSSCPTSTGSSRRP
jgi:peptide/nickel transport system substrate-binding protein